jgi:hypothetical protein
MPPLLEKEGKLLIYSILTFSSSLRRSTLTEGQGEVVHIFKNRLIEFV